MTEQQELLTINLILPIIKDLVTPRIESALKKIHGSTLKKNVIESSFKKYLLERYQKFLIIDTLVFPNQQTFFKELYQPLTLVVEEGYRDKVEIRIDGYSYNWLPHYSRVIIEDTAGMGKSTITRKLFLSIVEEKAGVPVLIDIRQLNFSNSILNEIKRQLSSLNKSFDEVVIMKILEEGGFIFLLDGFDEISLANREYVVQEIHSFKEKAKNNYFLITSRPEDSLVSFGDFQKAHIRPLQKKEAYELIARYDKYSFKKIAGTLIKQLEESEDEALKEYLANPFLVSLLYKAYEFKKDIPTKKSQFYRQVYDALFENHDLSKEGYFKREKYSRLNIDEFERVLRHIAYHTAISNDVEYSVDTIINIIDKVRNRINDLKFSAHDFLKDLLNTVPLFKKDGLNIKWGHKSLQDYFAAKFIWIDANEYQEAILEKIYKDPENIRFYNILDIFYELDPRAFEINLAYRLLKDLVDRKAELKRKFPDIQDTDINNRAVGTFTNSSALILSNLEFNENEKDQKYIEDDFHRLYNNFNKKLEVRHEGASIHHLPLPNRFILRFSFNSETNKKTIIDLIARRNAKLRIQDADPVEFKTIGSLEDEKFYLTNDDRNNPMNSLENFPFTSQFLAVSVAELDYNEAINMYNRISKYREGSGESDLLSW